MPDTYELIPEETYSNLPEESVDKFVVLVRVAQANMARMLDEYQSNDFSLEIKAQFISTLAGIADALGIEGLPKVEPDDLHDGRKYTMFQVYLAGIVSKVRLQGQIVSKPFSVALGRKTKAWIQQEINQLRGSIEESDLSQSKRDALVGKLDELEEELNKQRLGFARTLAITASIMTIVGGGTTALANAPKASEFVARVIGLIGEDKEKEDAERQRLAPPPKALPDHSPKRPAPFDNDLDDDVPF